MKLVDTICPNCGATTSVNPQRTKAKCEFCGSSFFIDEELMKVDPGNMEEAGYRFEKGRQKAQAEQKRNQAQRSTPQQKRKPKKKHGILWYILMFYVWIIALPMMIVVTLYKKGKINKKLAIILGVVAGSLWLIIILTAGGDSSTDTTSTTSTETTIERSVTTIQEPSTMETPIVEQSPTETPIVEVYVVSLTAENTNLALGDSVKLQASVMPEDAMNKSLTYASSDEAVLTVTDKGVVSAVGPGFATITATANNGISSSVSFNVDGTKRVVRLITRSSRTNDVNIGHEWSYSYEINGESIFSGDYTLTVGDYLTMKATITESDDNPDVGSNSTSHSVTQEDLLNGFSESFEVYVTENGGRNSGQSAIFTVTFAFNLK